MIDWNGDGKIDAIDIGISMASIKQDSSSIELLGYPFVYIQELEPERNLLGAVKQYNPKEKYFKKGSTPLNRYGNGPFCRFSLKVFGYRGISGVYALFDDSDLLYIGQTQNLEQRFNTGYGIIAPRNCYAGGQTTNCKINSMILQKYLNAERVFLFFFETPDYDWVERELIRILRPRYNGSLDDAHCEGSPPSPQVSDNAVNPTRNISTNAEFEAIWRSILAHEGETFYTVTNLEFTYKIINDCVVTSRTAQRLGKEEFKKAYRG